MIIDNWELKRSRPDFDKYLSIFSKCMNFWDILWLVGIYTIMHIFYHDTHKKSCLLLVCSLAELLYGFSFLKIQLAWVYQIKLHRMGSKFTTFLIQIRDILFRPVYTIITADYNHIFWWNIIVSFLIRFRFCLLDASSQNVSVERFLPSNLFSAGLERIFQQQIYR